MIKQIESTHLDPIIFDSKSKSLYRSPLNILLRFLRMVKIIGVYTYLLTSNKISILYLSLSGGWGQIYELIIITVSKIFKLKVYIHHHSFAYLNKRRLLTNLIVNISSSSTTHIVLCSKMKNLLKTYNENINVKIISNAAFIKDPKVEEHKQPNESITLGFLSNISFQKGIYEYIEVFKNLTNINNVKSIIAGPYSDRESQHFLEKHLIDLKNINYIGKLNEIDKNKFFNKIDALLFPSINEAEPLVILEAMSHGVPVIARSIGCINQIVDHNSGIIVNESDDFITVAYNQIIRWSKNPKELLSLQQSAIDRFKKHKENNIRTLKHLIDEFKLSMQ